MLEKTLIEQGQVTEQRVVPQAGMSRDVPSSVEDAKCEVSVVLPCLNESQTLASCIDEAYMAIGRLGIMGEVIVSDNGSSDGSQGIAMEKGARLISASTRGYGAALIAGCKAARGKYIVMGDADGSYDFEDCLPMIAKLRGGYDLAVGSRFKGIIQPGAMPWMNRYVGNPILTRILNVFFRSGLSDTQCGLRAFTNSAFRRMQLRSTGMEFASEMIVKARLLNLRMAEVPITLRPDGRKRPPHLRPWRDSWRHVRFLLLYSPIWLYIIPGLALLALGIGLNTTLNLLPSGAFVRLGPMSLGDHWTIPATIAALIGMYCLVLGVLAHAYSVKVGLYPARRWLKPVAASLSLETGLAIGILVALLGFAIEGAILLAWIRSSFGDLRAMRLGLYGLMWIALGVQMIMGSFALSIVINDTKSLPGDDQAAAPGQESAPAVVGKASSSSS